MWIDIAGSRLRRRGEAFGEHSAKIATFPFRELIHSSDRLLALSFESSNI